jgi:hypothetical protein
MIKPVVGTTGSPDGIRRQPDCSHPVDRTAATWTNARP